MANKNSAKKAIRQSIKRRFANRSVRSSVHTLAKKAEKAILAGDAAVATLAIGAYQSLASRAGRRNIISPLKVSRKVSRLVAKLKAASASVGK